jgi:rod shape determining protein RodA
MDKWQTLVFSLSLVAVPAVLVYLEPDLGTTLIFLFVWGVMILSAGLSWKQVLTIGAALAILLPLVWLTMQPYQRERITLFLNPNAEPVGAGYNVTQARIATGSGGLYGLGIGGGTQSQLQFLRIRHTDFIFSVIGEELGFWGGVFLFAVFAFLILRLLRAAMTAHTTYGRLIAVGFAASLFFQSFVNLGMNLGLMPVTGIPLPFMSSGGSSLITYLMMLGIVESILSHDKALSLRSSPFEKKKPQPQVKEYIGG